MEVHAMSRNPRSWWPALAGIALLATVACGGDEPSAGGDKAAYTVRGEVEQLPNPEVEGSDLMVRHEPIPDFENSKGEVVGMNAMTMPFPLAGDVSLEGIAVGDKVELTFEVQFEPSTSFVTTEVTKLPPDTELDFTGGASDHEGHDHGS
jgi:Cu/Ag efflux protein CusF